MSLRKYRRHIARANMEKMGLTHVCKRAKFGGVKLRSFFAQHWREYVKPEQIKAKSTRRKRAAR